MKYPKQILPRRFFKFINSNNLLKNNYYLIRHTPDKDIYDNSNIKIEKIAPQRDHLLNYSTSLKGIFKEDHIYFDIKSEYKEKYFKPWKLFMRGKCPNFNEINKTTDKGYFFLKFCDFHKLEIPEKNFTNPVDFKVICEIKHDPTRSNFWHFLFLWKDVTSNKEISDKYKNSRRVATAARTLISEKHKKTPQNYEVVPFSYYCIIPEFIIKTILKVYFFLIGR